MEKKLTLSRKNKMIFGVCGGIAEYFNIETTIVRIIWAFVTAFLWGCPVFFYVVCWAIIPSDKNNYNK